MWEEYAASIGTTAKNLTQEQKIQAEVNGILEETKFQIGDAAKLAGTYSGQIAMLSFNFQQLKVAVGEGLIPIAQAVLPSINAIIAALTKLARMFAKVTAMLFGKSTKVVATGQKEIADTGAAAAGSTDKLADSLGNAGSAAKKAAKDMETAIAPFDEFNILAFSAAQNASGAAGGGAGGGAADLGIPDVDTSIEDYEAIEEEFDTLADLFVKMLEDMLAAMPDFKQALIDFADAFNEMNRKLYEAFKDPRILPLVEELGVQLADALNGLVNAVDWNLWGRTLGAGLNLGLQFLTEFLYAFDWMNLGNKLAEFINGLASEIDWYDFGRLLWAGWKIALETLAGFIVGLDMPLMADAASKTVMGFFDEMKNTIDRIEWNKIGQQIATFLNEIDWYGVITSVFSAISSAINALKDLVRNFVDTLRWSDIATQIYTAINDSMGQIDWNGLGKALGDLFINAFNFLREVIAGIDWFQIGRDIADFLNGINWGELIDAIYSLLCTAFDAAIELLAGFISNADADSILAAAALLFGGIFGGKKILGLITGHITDFAKGLLSTIGTVVSSVFRGLDLIDATGIVGKLSQVFTIAKSSAYSFSEAIQMVFGPGSIIAGIAAIIGGAILAVKNFTLMLENGFNWVQEALMLVGVALTAVGAIILGAPAVVTAVVAGIVAALATLIAGFDELKALVGNVVDYFKSKFSEAGGNVVLGFLKGILDAVAGIGNWILDHFVNPFIDFFCWALGIHSPSTVFEGFGKNIVEGLLKGISETWNSIVEFFQEKINSMIEFFSSAWDGLKEKTSAAWESIKNALGEIWDSIREAAGTAFESIRDTISNAWDTLKEKTSAIWEGIKEALSALWESIKEKASTIFDAIKTTISNIWENVKNVTSTIWEGIKTTLSNLWDSLKEKATAIFENIKTAISAAWENIKAKTSEIWNNIKTTLETLWNNLKTTVTNIFNEIKNKIVEVWTNIKNEAVNKWNEITSTIQNKISEIKAKVVEGFTAIKETIVGKIKDAMDSLKNMDWLSVGRSIVDGILNGLHGIFEKLRDWASDVWDSVTSAFSGGGSKRSSVSRSSSRTRSAASYRMAPVPAGYEAYQIPKLANGAVIPPNQQFLAILGDQRRGMNIEAPLSTIEQALQNVMDRNGGVGGSRGPIEINLTVDKRVLARVIVPEINDMTRAAGKPVLLF